MNEPYQMDLFDLEDKTYQPILHKVNPFSISTLYLCPKCREHVGAYVDGDGWTIKKDECKNGHKMNWEAIK